MSYANNVYDKVESLKLGFDDYIVGKKLTNKQSKMAKNSKLKAAKGTRKFKDGKTFVIVNRSNDRVILLYQDFTNIKSQKDLKSLLGRCIMTYEEPTAMAHDKMVYWLYKEDGSKFTETDVTNFKDSVKGEKSGTTLSDIVNNAGTEKSNLNSYVSVKLSSNKFMMTKVKDDYKDAIVYILISSNKLLADLMK
jgi:hypothetical protein